MRDVRGGPGASTAAPASDLLIHGGAVVTVDDDGTIHDPGWVYVHGNQVAEVGAGEPPRARGRQAAEVIDAAGCAVMPGMTNAHTHLFQALFRGLADDKALLEWLRDCIWPAAVYLDADIAHAAALAGLVENLRGGATTVIDHQYIHTDEGIDDAVCRADDELGARFLLAHGFDPLVQQPEEVLRMACRNGAAAFGMPGAFGMLAEGRRADLLVVDLRSPFVAPVHRVPSALVYNATPADVRHVVVDGRILIRDGELVTADGRQIMAQAAAAAHHLFSRAKITTRTTAN